MGELSITDGFCCHGRCQEKHLVSDRLRSIDNRIFTGICDRELEIVRCRHTRTTRILCTHNQVYLISLCAIAAVICLNRELKGTVIKGHEIWRWADQSATLFYL